MICINDSGRFNKYITKSTTTRGPEQLSVSAQTLNYRLWDRMDEVIVHNTWSRMHEKVEYLD